jgi:hypothetical protein
MNYSNHYFYGEKVNSLRKATASQKDFNRFVSNSKNQLLKGEGVFCYYKDQLEALQNIFGEALVVTYSAHLKVWACHLKEGGE